MITKSANFADILHERPPHEAGGGRGSERGPDGHAAICRKNYRPGLIKLFDRLEADTDGRRACCCLHARGLVLFFGSGDGGGGGSHPI